MKLLLMVLAILGCALAGCGKKVEPATPSAAAGADQGTAAEPAAAPETPSAQAAPPPPTAATAGPRSVATVNGVVDPRLTAQLRLFIQEKGRLPESFAEFAGARLDSTPRLAPGLRFVIDPGTQEVKIAPK